MKPITPTRMRSERAHIAAQAREYIRDLTWPWDKTLSRADNLSMRRCYASDRRDLREVTSLYLNGKWAEAIAKARSMDTAPREHIDERIWDDITNAEYDRDAKAAMSHRDIQVHVTQTGARVTVDDIEVGSCNFVCGKQMAVDACRRLAAELKADKHKTEAVLVAAEGF